MRLLPLVLLFVFGSQFGHGFDAEFGLENRYFFEEGPAGQEKFQPSLRGELSYEFESDSGDDLVEVVLFGRYDVEDSERTHADLREFAWTHVGDSWELKAGVSKVFWGVTESAHLVDIVNQTDLVESIDGEDKLGQLMVQYSLEQDWGTLEFFLLPYFRERTFSGRDGRLNAPFQIDTDNAEYGSGAEQWRGDVAFRYSHYIGEFEFAVSHFSGTSREPDLQLRNFPAAPIFVPVYHTIDQTGLELQYIWEEWLFKLETISNAGLSDRYTAAVGGFEFTQVGILESVYDLGWLMEYHFDDRKDEATTNFEQDIFVGWRLAFNDADSSELLAGAIVDPENEETVYTIEVTKRLSNDLKANIEAGIFEGDSTPLSAAFEDEDYIQLELVYFL